MRIATPEFGQLREKRESLAGSQQGPSCERPSSREGHSSYKGTRPFDTHAPARFEKPPPGVEAAAVLEPWSEAPRCRCAPFGTIAENDFDEVLALIDSARTRAVAAVNTALIDLY